MALNCSDRRRDDRSRRDIEHLDREVKSWKNKVADKNQELSRKNRQIRQLEDKMALLRDSEEQVSVSLFFSSFHFHENICNDCIKLMPRGLIQRPEKNIFVSELKIEGKQLWNLLVCSLICKK